MKKTIAAALVLVLCLFSAASALTADELAGTWHAIAVERDGIMYYVPHNNSPLDMELNKDGSGKITNSVGSPSSLDFRWSLLGNTVVIDNKPREIRDNRIIMSEKKGDVYFAKEFPPECIWPEEAPANDPSDFYGVWEMKKMRASAMPNAILTSEVLQGVLGTFAIRMYVKEDGLYYCVETDEGPLTGLNVYTVADGRLTWLGDDDTLCRAVPADSGELFLSIGDEITVMERCDDRMWFCENCILFVEGDTCGSCGAKRPGSSPEEGNTEDRTSASVDADTVLYYNSEGGEMYHLDPNCRIVHPKYLPLTEHFTWSQVNDPQYSKLRPCNVCGAPER